ncbi:MAG: PQQ-binding-like beta-propeller repeat protein [Pirellulaceae bacterium]|jgi:outer membrane protein assembly factor BamB|nr:PQQ-binding-like beta-propeller repeat protein [Pirellulaceae bacterium]
MFRRFVAAAVLIVGTSQFPMGLTVVTAQQWTRFRGPNGSGISDAKTVPVQWTKDDYRWIAELPGNGHSSPVVWGDRVFVTSADEAEQTRYLLCLSAEDGSHTWQRKFAFKSYKHHKNNSSASNTPTVDGDQVYVLWQSRASSSLVALDHEGQELWRYDLGPYLHGQGGATSPILYEDLVVICNDHKTGSALVAVNRTTGKEVWKIPREGKRACYSTPCVFAAPNREPELIFTHCFEGIVGVDPSSGRQKWMIDVFGRHSQRAVGSPIVYGDLVIGSSGAGGGEKNVVAVQPASSDTPASEIYRIQRAAPHVPTPLIYNDRLFLWGDGGIVACIDAKTGKTIWTGRVRGNYFGSPVCVDGKLYCADIDGEVVVVEAADTFKELARNPVGDQIRSTPAVSGGTMFIRSVSHLYAIGGTSNGTSN